MSPSPKHYHAVVWVLILSLTVLFTLLIIYFQGKKYQPADKGVLLNNANDAIISHRVYTIYYTENVFSPTNLNIKAGDTVVFKNNSDYILDLVSFKGINGGLLFDGKKIKPHDLYSITIVNSGIYFYKDGLAQTHMGSLIVQ